MGNGPDARGSSVQPSKVREDSFVGAGESEFVKLRECEPFALERTLPAWGFSAIGFEGDAVTRYGMLDDAEWFGGCERETEFADGFGARLSQP